MKPKGIVFDLDETLTPSKSQMDSSSIEVFYKLVSTLPVGIASGAALARIKWQVVDLLPPDCLKNICILPTGGAAMFVFNNGEWRAVYEHLISKEAADHITEAIEECVERSSLCDNTTTWGPRVEWRGSQVTFSALGQEAPYDAKAAWDPDKQKRLHLREMLIPKLEEYDVVLGGTTSIDIIPKGINKAYGVTRFAEHIGVNISDILYVGDDLQEGGNDHVVAATTTAMTKAVTSPADTMELIDNLLQNNLVLKT